MRYEQEVHGRARLRAFLAHFPNLPTRFRTDAKNRELWILLGSHTELFLNASKPSAPGLTHSGNDTGAVPRSVLT